MKLKSSSKLPSISRRKVVAVTHGPFCLDGMASAVCLGRFYGPSRVTPIFTHPSDVDRVIAEVAQSAKGKGDLWIVDITWKNSETELIFKELTRKGWRVFWIDHHTSALEKNDKEIQEMGITGWVASNRYSAARLLYDFMADSPDLLGKPPEAFKAFRKTVLLADDNDRWIHRMSGSRKLALAVSFLGGNAMYKELLRVSPDLKYTPKMEEAYRFARRELSGSIALANRTRIDKRLDGGGPRIITALCLGYTSEVADSLRGTLENESVPAIFLLYNLGDGRISIRKTPACKVNLAELAGRFGGGGHPAAAGFDLPQARDHLQKLLLAQVEEALDKD